MKLLPAISAALLLFLFLLPASAEPPVSSLLPTPLCGEGWKMEGKVLLYDRETLSDRVNGEAELYFPYGFEQLAYARYSRGGGGGIDVDIYRVGSLLDAFGLYSSYRPEGGKSLRTGVDGTISGNQLFLYQG